MRPGGGREKGAAFEREIAALLDGELGIKFKREIEQYRVVDLGDLRCENERFPFSIECKRYAKGTGAKPEWWAQCCKAATAAQKLPALIYKYDHHPIVCRVPWAAFMQIASSELVYRWEYYADLTFTNFTTLCREILSD